MERVTPELGLCRATTQHHAWGELSILRHSCHLCREGWRDAWMDGHMHGRMDGWVSPVLPGSCSPGISGALCRAGVAAHWLFPRDKACWERTSSDGFKLKECQGTRDTIRG